MKLLSMMVMLLIPLLCTALPRKKISQEKEKTVIPASYGSQMEEFGGDYSDDEYYLQAFAVKDEAAKEGDVQKEEEIRDEADEASQKTDETAAEEGEEEAEEQSEGEEPVPAGLDFTTDIETEQEGMEMVQKIAKALKAVNKWMAGLVSYWNRIVEDSGAVADILASAKEGDNNEEAETAGAPEAEGEEADAKGDAEVVDEAEATPDAATEADAEAETKADAEAETTADAEEEVTDAAPEAAETAEGNEDAADEEGDAAAAETAADKEGDAAAAETAAEADVQAEDAEPKAERVMQMARRRHFLRKPQPTYVDY